MDAWFNEGSIDRVIRLALGIMLLMAGFIFFNGVVVAQVIAFALAIIALATGVIGVCPLYRFFGIRTRD